MAQRVIDRRQVLRGAGVAAGGAAVGAFAFAAPASANDTGSGKLAGSWLIIRQDDGSPDRVTAVLSFAQRPSPGNFYTRLLHLVGPRPSPLRPERTDKARPETSPRGGARLQRQGQS